jgi:hypothetical protein
MRIKFNSINLILLLTVFTTLTVQSQSVLAPFENTWYGFNTQTGTDNYYLTYAKLVDLDNDGDSDVVASKYFVGFSPTVTGFVVLFNQGGFFNSAPVHYTSSKISKYVETADVNNDNYADVIVANTGGAGDGNTVQVYLNQGNGSFGRPASYNVGAGPTGITVADFNNDGHIDLAVANYGYQAQGNSVSVLINNGSGSFNTALSFPAGDSPYRLSAGRINSDNLPDIVVANLNGRFNVLINSGGTDFSNRTEYVPGPSTYQNYWTSLCLADMDHDNDIDVLYSSSGLYTPPFNYIYYYKNENGILTSPQAISNDGGSPTHMEAYDINGDGWNDIISSYPNARFSDGFRINFSDGSGGFLTAVKYDGGQNTNDVMVGDVDNDHLPDILTADSYSMAITVHKNLGNGVFPKQPLYETGNSIAGCVDAADIDGDGDLDVVVSAWGRAGVGVTVKYLLNNGDGSFGPGITCSIRGGGVQAKFRDLNGDNKPDILFATAINSAPYDFHYAINNGDGTFGPVQTKPIGSCGWYDIDAGDFDNDGDNDVVITEWLGCPGVPNSAQRIFICLNQGNAVFSNPIIKVVSPEPTPIGLGDFNKDGNLDIVTGVVGAKLEINLGLGNGDFMAPVGYSFGWQGIAEDLVVADFNNDSNLDIASCNLFENYWISIFKGNGDGTFQAPQNLPTAYSPDLLNVEGITCGDLDNDGDKDIMVSNAPSKALSLYYNNGDGTFEYRMRAGSNNGAWSPFFGDFDNDGRGDVVGVGALPLFGLENAIVFVKGKNTGLIAVSNTQTTVPHAYVLGQNYPNPFNPTTSIKYSLPNSGIVTLSVYDMTGKLVEQLLNSYMSAGTYEIKWDASGYASGVYFYTMKTKDFTETKKMVLIK